MTGGLVQNCIIVSNASYAGFANNYGGSVRITGGTLRNCLVIRNCHNEEGGGIGVLGGTVENCTVVSNTAGGSAGGGIFRTAGTVTNTIVFYNKRSGVPDDIGGAVANFGYCCSPGLAHDPLGTGNITNEPLFVSLSVTNGSLLKFSPCINAGINLGWMAAPGSVDLAGNPRRVARADIGAYEVQFLRGTTLMIR